MGTEPGRFRPVKIIVPIGAGSAPDAAARLVADGTRQRWGQPVIIENRPGADASVGTGAFANANDDHTLLFGFASTLTVNPLIQEKVPFDPARDFVPISAVTNTIIAIAVHRDLPAHSLADLARIAEAMPGKILWGAGPSWPRFLFAAFLKQRNLDMLYVPYRDAAAAPIDLAEGRVQLLITSLQATVAPVRSGKARVIAIANTHRAATLPDVQTASEAGYPEMSIDGLIGFFGWAACRQGCATGFQPTSRRSSKTPRYVRGSRRRASWCLAGRRRNLPLRSSSNVFELPKLRRSSISRP